MNLMDRLNFLGLIANFAGTVVVALSIGRPKNGDLHILSDPDQRGRREITHIAMVLWPRAFWWGLFIIAAGFVLQIVALLWGKL
jgi:hypothetical protein